MRVLVVVGCMLVGAVAGFFIAGYAFDATHPPSPSQSQSGTGRTWADIHAESRAYQAAIDRQQARWPWFYAGVGLGCVAGCLASVPALWLMRRPAPSREGQGG